MIKFLVKIRREQTGATVVGVDKPMCRGPGRLVARGVSRHNGFGRLVACSIRGLLCRGERRPQKMCKCLGESWTYQGFLAQRSFNERSKEGISNDTQKKSNIRQ